MVDQVLGRGTIELVGDARKLRGSIDQSKKSIRSLGKTQKDVNKNASKSVDRYITKLKQQNTTVGKSRREQELYKLALRGASNAQLRAANSALLLQQRQAGVATVLRNLRRALAVTGGLAAIAFVRMTKGVIDAQDALSKLSQKINVSVEDLAGLQHAATLAGVSNEQLTKGLKSVSSQLFDAANGLLESKRNFAALGIEIRNTEGSLRSAEDVLIEVADKFVSLADSTEKTALATKLFGKAGLDLIPLLNQGSAGIAALVAEGKKLNPVTAESARQSEIFNDNLTRLKGSAESVGISFTNELIGPLSEVSALLAEASVNSGKFWETLTGTVINRFSGDLEATRIQIKTITGEIQNSRALLQAHQNSFLPALFADDIALLEYAIKGKEARLTALRAQSAAEQSAIFTEPSLTRPVLLPPPEIADITEDNKKGVAIKSRLDAQNKFIASLDKGNALLGKTAVQIKVYEASLLGLQGAQLKDVEVRAQRIEDFKNEEKQLDSFIKSYTDASDQYIAFAAELTKNEQVSARNIERMELELSLVNETTKAREIALAVYDAEQSAKERLIRLDGLREAGDADPIYASIEANKLLDIEMAKITASTEEQIAKTQELDQFGVQAARNLQTAFADFLFDPFDKGLDGMLIGFSNVLRRMVAEAASKQILKGIFGSDGAGGADIFGGLLKAGGAFLSSLNFGGGLQTGLGPTQIPPGFINGGFSAFADGGSHRGGLRLVGETGPELEVTGPSRIYSTQQTKALLSGGKEVSIVSNVTINQQGSGDNQEMDKTAAERVGQEMRRVLRGVVREEIFNEKDSSGGRGKLY